MTRPLALLPLGLYVLYLFVQFLDVADHDAVRRTSAREPGVVRRRTGRHRRRRRGQFWLRSDSATRSPRRRSSGDDRRRRRLERSGRVRQRRRRPRGRASVSLANVLGSNVFDLLVAIPAGVLVAGSLEIAFPHVVPMMGFLILATVVFFAIVRTDMLLTRREAWTLLVLYGVFVGWLILEASVRRTSSRAEVGRLSPTSIEAPSLDARRRSRSVIQQEKRLVGRRYLSVSRRWRMSP